MASVGAAEKTPETLLKEIDELHRQRKEITERLGAARGPRRGGFRPAGAVGGRLGKRGPIRDGAPDAEEQRPSKRLASQVVKLEEGEVQPEDTTVKDAVEEDRPAEGSVNDTAERNERKVFQRQSNGSGFGRDGNLRVRKKDEIKEPTPRECRLVQDANLVKRNRRMMGQLLGTLVKFSEEQEKLATSEAYMRRSDSLKRAEEKAREESERLRQQQREQIEEKRKRDLTLLARVDAKAYEKLLELDFLHWTEHHKRLSKFLRTKAEPPIYYMPAKPLPSDPTVEQQKEQAFLDWRSARRAELSEFERRAEEEFIANAEKKLEHWQNVRNARRGNNLVNLQETMDKELETHQQEQGPKTRRITGVNEDEEDVEDITAEDELMDEVLDVHERYDGDAVKLSENVNGSSSPPAEI